MRGIVIVIVIIGVLFALSKLTPSTETKAPVVEPAGPAYAEARVKIATPQREIEMVVVGEKPSAADCNSASGSYKLPAICTGGQLSCKLTKVECSDTLGDRYLNMIAGKPSVTNYVHFVRKDNGVERNYALVAWGLTVDESKGICEAMRAADAQKGAASENITCI